MNKKEFEAKFDVILDASSETFISDLKKALNLKDGEEIHFITPQFERTDGRKIKYFPRSPEEYAALPLLDPQNLKEIGCGVWNKENGKTLWLFPKEWYAYIPNGTRIVDINGDVEQFVRGETDDDIRYGMLAYGFEQTEQ